MAKRDYIYQDVLKSKINTIHKENPSVKDYWDMDSEDRWPYYEAELAKEMSSAANSELDSLLKDYARMVKWYRTYLEESFSLLHAKESDLKRLEAEIMRLEPKFPFIMHQRLTNIDNFIYCMKILKKPITEGRKELWWQDHFDKMISVLKDRNIEFDKD